MFAWRWSNDISKDLSPPWIWNFFKNKINNDSIKMSFFWVILATKVPNSKKIMKNNKKRSPSLVPLQA
jgi:hypothetical protein